MTRPPSKADTEVATAQQVEHRALSEAALAGELMQLRQDEGLTPRHVRTTAPTLRAAARRWQETQDFDVRKLDEASAAVELVIRALAEERPAHWRESLRVDYGLSQEGPTLAARQEEYIAQLDVAHQKKVREAIDAHRTPPRRLPASTKTFRRWALDSTTQLAARIIRMALELEPQSDEKQKSSLAQIAVLGKFPALHVVLREIWCTYGPAKHLIGWMTKLLVRANEPGEHTHLTHHEFYSDRREGVLQVIPEFGCHLIGQPWFENDITYTNLSVSRWLDQNETHMFVYRVAVKTEVPSRPFVQMTADYDETELRFFLQFDMNCSPVEAWTFGDLPSMRIPITGHWRNPVAAPERGYVIGNWHQLKAGHSYGIGWNWPAETLTNCTSNG